MASINFECSNAKCNISSEKERYISCWLCEKFYHLKCVKITGRQFDTLGEGNGFRWHCPSCKENDKDISQFFRQTKKSFYDFGIELKSLMNKFKHYEELFNGFHTLNLRKIPPNLEIPTKTPIINLIDNNDDPINTFKTPLPLTPNVSNSNIINPTSTQSSTPSVNNNNLISPKPLKVIEANKSIFISRFSFDTTENDIHHYIKLKLNVSELDLIVNKFNYKYSRAKASFRLTVPETYFNTIINENFWPKNTFIREFIFKNKNIDNIVKLPLNPKENVCDNSKNY